MRALRAAGHQLVVLTRHAAARSMFETDACEVVIGDLRAPDQWRSEAANCDAIVHTAQQSMGFPITIHGVLATVDADATAAAGFVAAMAAGDRMRHLIFTSGLWAFGDHGADWIDETMPYRPRGIDLRRASREQMLFEAAERYGRTASVLVLGNVYGPAGSFRGYVERAKRGEHRYIGDGGNYMSPVHFVDVGEAYVKALVQGRHAERYIIADNEPIAARRHAELLCNVACGPPPTSMGIAEAAALLGELHVRSLVQSIRLSNAKAKRDLGWVPVYPTFADGVRSAIADLKC